MVGNSIPHGRYSFRCAQPTAQSAHRTGREDGPRIGDASAVKSAYLCCLRRRWATHGTMRCP
jgi:hypothetical protein